MTAGKGVLRLFLRPFSKGPLPLKEVKGSSKGALLLKLRRATGLPFPRCKEALEKEGGDPVRAEEWLRAQALSHGWEKAKRLQGRSTQQGLVALLTSKDHKRGVLVEVNCESEFISRNKKFQQLVNKVTTAVFNVEGDPSPPEQGVLKIPLSPSALSTIPSPEGRPLSDLVAETIGGLGENLVIRRALLLKVPSADPSLLLAGYTHPVSLERERAGLIQSGRFGALVAYKVKGNQIRVQEIGRELCQHIVGMNPVEIGSSKEPVPSVEKPSGEEDEDSRVLLDQEFLLDPSLSVRDFLSKNRVQVLDFVRFEVRGQLLDEEGKS